MSRALLIIDIQNDYFPGGSMELVGSRAASMNATSLLTTFRKNKLTVVHIQHVSKRADATFFRKDTKGVEIHESVTPHATELVFQKHFPNSFRETDLLEHLRSLQFETLVIAGMMTHMCVDTTVRAAADFGFECILAHDACATLDLSFNGVDVLARDVHASYLAALDGSFARVLSTKEVILAVSS
jgi:nicotinamidase-related amidase